MKNKKKVLRPLHGLVQGVPRLPRKIPQSRSWPGTAAPDPPSSSTAATATARGPPAARSAAAGAAPRRRFWRPAASAEAAPSSSSSRPPPRRQRPRRQSRGRSPRSPTGTPWFTTWAARGAPASGCPLRAARGGAAQRGLLPPPLLLLPLRALRGLPPRVRRRLRLLSMPLLLRLLELPLAREKLRQVFFRKHSQQKKKSPVRPSPRHHLKSFPRSLISG